MPPPVRWWPRTVRTIARTYGLRGGLQRATHEIRRKLGLFRTEPNEEWPADAPVGTPPDHPFRVDGDRLAAATDVDLARTRADRVLGGEYQAYRWDWRPFPADPAGWLRHPTTGGTFDGVAPWWKIPHLDPEIGDIKDVWEPARFGWVYDLVRGYLVTGDDRYARGFHDRFQDWLDSSPPFHGPHWSCGQETSIRAMALLYAEANLAGAPSSTPAAMDRIARVLAASGERVADAFGYALSQRNNHGISEATGLIVLGTRLQGRHPDADRWLRQGRRWLDRLLRGQLAEDGWYIQHSFNYLRLALDQTVVAARVLQPRGAAAGTGANAGAGLSRAAVRRIAAAVQLLGAVIEPNGGRVPNHGPNDGAFVHPITLAGYGDYRPTLTAVCATFGFPLPGGIDPDRETVAWLGLEPPIRWPAPEDGVRVGASGWATARVGPAHVFLRAGHYRSRPGHLDPLHVAVRCGSEEVVVDPGTYSYNAPPLDRELASGRAHNGPILDGREPAVRGPRFLWLTWPNAVIRGTTWDPETGTAKIEAEIPGRVRRHVTVTADEVRVEDRALDPAASELSARWLVHPDSGGKITAEAPAAVDRGSGWYAPRYGEKRSAPAVLVRQPTEADAAMTTRIQFGRQP